MEFIIQQGIIFDIIPYIANEGIRSIINLTRLSKSIRQSFGLNGTASIGKKCLRIYFQCALMNRLKYIKYPTDILLKAMRLTNSVITGSTSIMIIENYGLYDALNDELSDLDIFAPNKKQAEKLIKLLLDRSKNSDIPNYFDFDARIKHANKNIQPPIPNLRFEKNFNTTDEAIEKEKSDVILNHTQEVYKKIGFINSIEYGIIKIDILNREISDETNFDMSICSNTIASNGSATIYDLNALLNYQIKYNVKHQEYMRELFYNNYTKEDSDTISKYNITHTKLYRHSINTNETRLIKYTKRGYISINSPYDLVDPYMFHKHNRSLHMKEEHFFYCRLYNIWDNNEVCVCTCNNQN
jgi:hypothetical protein